MSWLVIIILSYLFFSLASLGDKIILAGSPKPKSYTFYVGLLNILAVLLIPFIDHFTFPTLTALFWIILEAVVYVVGLYAMFVAIEEFDVSKVMPTIGAAQPIFIFLLAWMFWGSQEITLANTIAFVVLLLGSVIISIEKNPKLTRDSLVLTFLTALMFSLDYVFTKFVYLNQSFLQGFIWMRIFSALFVMVFFFDRQFRKEVFAKQNVLGKNTGVVFLSTQAAGGIANILQNFAISLAPVAYLAIMNSLKGIQYVFLFAITLFLSFFFPKVLKEETSKRVIIQKIISILLIAAGLAILVMN
jgi:drug/metabolite transporter (DMT)-like permease